LRQSRRARTVLIVGDDVEVAATLKHVVNDAGYRSMWARGSREAIWAMTDERPALVLIDLAPRIAGRQLLAKMDRSPALARIPRAVLTERGHVGFAGFDGWALLLKPIDLEPLFTLIRRVAVAGRSSAVSPAVA
jgi:DNA-binding response OmpR family regulator